MKPITTGDREPSIADAVLNAERIGRGARRTLLLDVAVRLAAGINANASITMSPADLARFAFDDAEAMLAELDKRIP